MQLREPPAIDNDEITRLPLHFITLPTGRTDNWPVTITVCHWNTLSHPTAMRFEHLIQINAPEAYQLPTLTRAQLWRGLALRAYDPADFVLGLEGCAVTNHVRDGDIETLERTLYFGAFEVHDRVMVDNTTHSVRVDVPATEKWPACTAVTNIEEPEPLSLFVRFVYEWNDNDAAELALDDTARRLREQACLSVDMDTVARIREMSLHDLS